MSRKDGGCDWFCDGCGVLMNSQNEFDIRNGTWTCVECGYVNDVTENNISEGISDDVYRKLKKLCRKQNIK